MKEKDWKEEFPGLETLVRDYMIPAIKYELREYYEAIDKKLKIFQGSNEAFMEQEKRIELLKTEIWDLKNGIGAAIAKILLKEK